MADILRFPHNAAATPPPSEIGWVRGDDGAWHPPGYQGPAMPFVLAMQKKMAELVAEAARTNWLEGYWTGVRFIAPFTGAGFVVGFLLGFVL